MIPRGLPYDEAMRRFRWNVPERFNIGRAVCERHEPNTLAMIEENADGGVRHWTFGQLLAASSRLANALAARGITKGQRVAVFLSQGAELTICHLAGYRMGAVVLPLFTLFGEEALEYRMDNAEASAIITDITQLPKILAVRERLPHLKTIIVIGAGKDGAHFLDWDTLLGAASDSFSDARHARRGSGAADLHLGHDRPAQGRAACPSHDAGLGAAGGAVAEPLAARQRDHVDAGRMGVDRRPVRRAVPGLVLRHAGAGPPLRQVRSRARLRHAGQAQGRRQLHPADRAQDDAAGEQAARALGLRHPRHLDRRRGDGRGAAGVGPRHLRHDDLGRLRPDRDEPDAAQFARLVRGPARLVRPRLPRPQGRDRRQPGQPPAARRGRPDRRLAARPDRHARVLAQPRGHGAGSSPATGC